MSRTCLTRPIAGLLLLAGLASPAAAATSPYDQVESIGVGTLSCALWLNTPSNQHYGNQWIFGFFTGINTYGSRRGSVGKFLGQAGIVAQVQGICQAMPSLPLEDAAGRAYNAMLSRGQ